MSFDFLAAASADMDPLSVNRPVATSADQHGGTAADVFGWVGFAFGLLLVLAPFPIVLRVHRERSTGHYDIAPYALTLGNNLCWIFNLLGTSEHQPFYLNLISSVFEASFCAYFVARAAPGCKRRFTLTFAAVVAGPSILFGVCGLAGLAFSDSDSAFHLAGGVIAMMFNIAMFAAPLSVVGQVVRERNADPFPLPVIVVSLFLSSSFVAFAQLVGDWHMLVPNACGVVLSLFQLALVSWCKLGGARPLREADEDDGDEQVGGTLLQRDAPSIAARAGASSASTAVSSFDAGRPAREPLMRQQK